MSIDLNADVGEGMDDAALLPYVTSANVASLKLSFSFSTGLLRGHEAAPIVTNDTMYIVTPYPNVLFALDLTRPGAPV